MNNRQVARQIMEKVANHRQGSNHIDGLLKEAYLQGVSDGMEKEAFLGGLKDATWGRLTGETQAKQRSRDLENQRQGMLRAQGKKSDFNDSASTVTGPSYAESAGQLARRGTDAAQTAGRVAGQVGRMGTLAVTGAPRAFGHAAGVATRGLSQGANYIGRQAQNVNSMIREGGQQLGREGINLAGRGVGYGVRQAQRHVVDPARQYGGQVVSDFSQGYRQGRGSY